MFVFMISVSSSKLGHLGSKTRTRAKSKENPFNTLEIKFLKKSSLILFKIFILMISRSKLKLGRSGKKRGHWAKSKENLVNALDVA